MWQCMWLCCGTQPAHPCTASITRTKHYIKLNLLLHNQECCPRDPTWDTRFPGTIWKVCTSTFPWVFSSRRHPRCQFRDSAENMAWFVCRIVTEEIQMHSQPIIYVPLDVHHPMCRSMQYAIKRASSFLFFLITYEVPQMASSKPSWCCVCIHPSKLLLLSGRFSSWLGPGQAGRACGPSRCGRSWSMELLQHCLHMSTPMSKKKAHL